MASFVNETETRTKITRAREDDDSEPNGITNCDRDGGKLLKAKRHDIELPSMAEVDIRLAEKLDSLLSLGSNKEEKPRFFLNKLRSTSSDTSSQLEDNNVSKEKILPLIGAQKSLSSEFKPRNLSSDQLKERLLKKYDTLVPELRPDSTNVKPVKILSAKESIELARDQARKQLERQMELGSIYGNQLAHDKGTGSFRFNDGYDTPERRFPANNKHNGQRAGSKQPIATPEDTSHNSPKAPIEVVSQQPENTASILQFRSTDDLNLSVMSTKARKSVRFSPITEVNIGSKFENEDEDEDKDNDDEIDEDNDDDSWNSGETDESDADQTSTDDES